MRRFVAYLLVLMVLFAALPAFAEKDGFLTILLIGQDDAADDTVQKNTAEYGRADAILIATLELRTGETRLISVDRDYLIELPLQGESKLCIANFVGGPHLLLEKVNELLGLSIDRYAMVDKQSMGKIVGKIGGVTIDIREEDLESTGLKKTGPQKLSQSQVIRYMASRDVEDNQSDVERNERQRIVLNAIMEQVLSRGFEGMIDLATAVLPLMQTNILISEIIDVAAMVITKGVHMPAQDRTPRTQQRLTMYIKAHNVVYVEDMAQEKARVATFLYGEN